MPVKTIRIFSVFASFLHPLNPAFYRDRIRTSFLSDPYPFWAAGPSVSIFSGALSASGSPRPLMNAATVSFSSGAGIRVRGAGMGMPEEVLEKILTDNSKVPKHGSGVGVINVQTCNPDDAVKTQRDSRVMNYFCGDVQVRGEYPTYMNRYFGENNIEIKMEKGDLEILKEGCVDFYTFSYYMSTCVSSSPRR